MIDYLLRRVIYNRRLLEGKGYFGGELIEISVKAVSADLDHGSSVSSLKYVFLKCFGGNSGV
jgi:acyl-CoA thioesterase